MVHDLELAVCAPVALNQMGFNPKCKLPHGLGTKHVQSAMQEFLDFLTLINTTMHGRQIPRLESFMMTASFSSLVGEFMNSAIPKYCSVLAKNTYHNGHPDLGWMVSMHHLAFA